MDMIKRVFSGECKDINEKDMTITAYVSTNGRDRQDEVLNPDGADLKHFRKNPVVLWAHDYAMPPIAKALWVKSDDKGLISKMQFASTEFAKEIFGLFKDGFMSSFSVGFLPKQWEDGDGEKIARRTYTNWELLEYSAVPVPANPEALSLAISKGMSESVKKWFEVPTGKQDEKPKEEEQIEGTLDVQEVIKENTRLVMEIENMTKAHKEEVGKLRKELYTLLVARMRKDASEITDDDIRTMIANTVTGVIRQRQGKV